MDIRNLKSVELYLIALIIFGIYLRFLWSTDFTYSVFTDRDLLRGLNLWTNFQYLGAESTFHTARTPGGFVAYFFNALQLFNKSTNFIHTFVVLMDVSALVFIPLLFTKYIGRYSALFIAAIYGGSLVALEELWKFWNPSMTPLFSVLIFWQLLRYMIDGKASGLAISLFLIGVAAQFHMSFLTLVPLLTIMTIVVKPRTSLKIWLLSIGCLLVSFAPYITIDGLNNFSNTAVLIQSSQPPAGKATMDIEKHLLAAFRITGGRSFPVHTLPELISSSRLYYWGALIVFNIGLAALFIFIPFLGFSLFSKNVANPDQNRRLKIVLLFFAAAAILIASKNVNNMQGRYHLPFLFPVLLLLGFSFSSFLRWADQSKRRFISTIITAAVLVPLIVKDGFIAYFYNTSSRESNSSFGVKHLIVDILKTDFGWSNEDIDLKIALWLEPSGRGRRSNMNPWDAFGDDENAALSYIARASKVTPKVRRIEGCALVQMPERRGMPLKPLNENLIKAALPYSEGFSVLKVVEREDIRVVGYRHDHPNCVRSFGNAYMLTEAEKLAEKLSAGMEPLESRDLGWNNRTHRSVAILPNNSPIFVEISNQDNITRVVFHANTLRGHAKSFRITRGGIRGLRLSLTSLDGTHQIHFVEKKPLGSVGNKDFREKGLFTPWVILGPVLPKGKYFVDLNIGVFETNNFYGSQPNRVGPLSIRLADELAWH